MRGSRRAAVSWPRHSPAREPASNLVALVTRLVMAQAGLAGAIGCCYSRRHGPGIVMTVMLAVALCGLAAVVRTGSHQAWVLALGFEAVFSVAGLLKFITAYFLGGTLFALITLGVLVHPAVARAFGGRAGTRGSEPAGTRFGDIGDTVADPLRGQAAL